MALAVFRCDASAPLGSGHVRRCLTLADALADVGWSCRFLTASSSLEVVPALKSGRHEIVVLENPEADRPVDLDKFADAFALFVVDHYGRGRDFDQSWRDLSERILVIDDLANREHDADILIDQTLGRTPADYETLVPSHCHLLLGPVYALLRPEFSASRWIALERRASLATRRLFISVGGTDPLRLTQRVLAGLENTHLDGADIVVGPSDPGADRLEHEAYRTGTDIVVHIDPDDVSPIMVRADLAIGAVGVSAWERCCLGLPSLLIVVAANQTENADRLVECGAAELLRDLGPECIEAAFCRLLDDSARLRAMSLAAACICDGLGTQRVALALSPEKAKVGDVRLRPATLADGHKLWEWQTLSGIRRFARNPRVPAWPEHLAWLKQRLGDLGSLLNIVLVDEIPAGVLRLDRQVGGAFEVSILVDPAVQGKGIAHAALRAARRLLPSVPFQAEVHRDNVASRRLFSSCGYQEESGQGPMTMWRNNPSEQKWAHLLRSISDASASRRGSNTTRAL
jgi:UDP-2,4-diacetamido-2,4,6-trideoxy-beta-L-altropyranose hydrolase